ncbi:hypothetical protein [Streptomyces sp. NPDC048191]
MITMDLFAGFDIHVDADEITTDLPTDDLGYWSPGCTQSVRALN